ncbi:hypothetical protein ACS0TY_000788 [Phlomoides rotata]
MYVFPSISLLVLGVIPSISADDADAYVQYHTQKGDWNRYFAEITIHSRKTFMDEAESTYKMVATRIDEVKLPSFDPLRLRLQLSRAIFHYDILNEHLVARDIAVKARDDSNGELGGLSREAHSESYNMLEAIQNQLIKWDFQ